MPAHGRKGPQQILPRRPKYGASCAAADVTTWIQRGIGNSARPPSTVSIKRPCGVVVTAHVSPSDRKPAPWLAIVARVFKRSRVHRLAWDEIIADLHIWIGVRRRRSCATYMLLGRCSADLLSLNILYNKDKFLKCGNVPIPPRLRGGLGWSMFDQNSPRGPHPASLPLGHPPRRAIMLLCMIAARRRGGIQQRAPRMLQKSGLSATGVP
jgi:hypothetical protein